MTAEVPAFLLRPSPPPAAPARSGGHSRFIAQGMRYLAGFLSTTHLQWEMAQRRGLLQRLDARVKVLFLLLFAIVVSLKHTLLPALGISGLVLVLALWSRLELLAFYRRVLLLTFFFGFLLALPACLNLFVPGALVVVLYRFAAPQDLWIYHLPAEIGITREGLRTVALLSSRVGASIGLSLLVIHTTPVAEFVRALKSLRVPAPFLMVLTLSLKFIFVFARTMEGMYLGQKSRTVAMHGAEGRKWVAGRMALLFRRTQHRYEGVFRAMVGRGFAGEVHLHPPGRLQPLDWVAGSALLAAGLFFWYL